VERGRPWPAIADGSIEALKAHPFPGKSRELKNIIERALIESEGQPIEIDHLHMAPRAMTSAASPATPDQPQALPVSLKQAELVAVQHAMAHTKGNISEAARLLGITRARLYRKLADGKDESPSR